MEGRLGRLINQIKEKKDLSRKLFKDADKLFNSERRCVHIPKADAIRFAEYDSSLAGLLTKHISDTVQVTVTQYSVIGLSGKMLSKLEFQIPIMIGEGKFAQYCLDQDGNISNKLSGDETIMTQRKAKEEDYRFFYGLINSPSRLKV